MWEGIDSPGVVIRRGLELRGYYCESYACKFVSALLSKTMFVVVRNIYVLRDAKLAAEPLADFDIR